MLFDLRKHLSQPIDSFLTDKNQGSANYYVTLIAGCMGILLWIGTGNGLAVTTNNSSNNTTNNNATSNNATATPTKPSAPVIRIKSEDFATKVSQQISVGITARDANNDKIQLVSPDLPPGASLIIEAKVAGNTMATLNWTPTAAQVGSHNITLIASDGKLSSSTTMTILVRGVVLPAAGGGFMPAGGPPPADISTGLLAYYRLNSNLLDSSGNSLNAMAGCNGMAYDSSSSNFFAHFAGGTCFHLSQGQLYPHAYPLSVSLWFKVASLETVDMGLFSLYNDGTYVTIDEGALNYRFTPGFATPDQVVRVEDISDYQWHHFVMAYDSGYAMLYLDGQLAASTPQVTRIKDGPEDFMVGLTLFPHVFPSSPGSNDFHGDVDEVRIYSRALSLLDVSDVYNRDKNVFLAPSNLTGQAVSISQINLQWQDNTGNEEGFKIYRSTGFTFTLVGTVGPNITTFSNTTGLNPNSWYRYRVEAFNTALNQSFTSNTIEVKTLTNTTPITAPANFSARVTSSSNIELGWDDNSNNEDGFILERSPNGSTLWTTLATRLARRGGGIFDPLFLKFYVYDTGLTANTRYYYRVRAYNLAGSSTNVSLNATTLLVGESSPENLEALTFSASQINLTWEDTTTMENGYRVQRSTDGTTWTTLPALLVSNTTSYSVTGLSEGTEYLFRVYATFPSGHTAYSGIGGDITPLAKPTGLTATPVAYNQINLAWVDNSAKEEGYNIYQSTDGENFYWLDSIGANARTYSHINLNQDELHYYYVEAFNDTTYAYSLPSDTASARTPLFTIPAPSNLTATAVSYERVNLSWTDNSTNEDGFVIQISEDGSTFESINTVNPNIRTYSAVELEPDTLYYFRVQVFHNDPEATANSNVVSRRTPLAILPPSNLTVSVVSYQQVNLSWTDNSNNEEGFQIETSSDGIDWEYFDTVNPNIHTYAAMGLEQTTLYYFRIEAFNDTIGYVADSNVVSAQTPFMITPPSQLVATVASYAQINLSWRDNSSNEDGFNVQVSEDGEFWLDAGTVATNVKNFSVTDLDPDTLYYFRIEAFDNETFNTSYSNVLSARTQVYPLAAPSNLAAQVISFEQIDLTWRDNSNNEDGFTIQISNDGTNWTDLDYVDPGIQNYSAVSLDPNTLYYYRIQASHDSPIATANSNVVSARTLMTQDGLYAQDAMNNLLTIKTAQLSYKSTHANNYCIGSCASNISTINANLHLNIVPTGGTAYSCNYVSSVNAVVCLATRQGAFYMGLNFANPVSSPTGQPAYCVGSGSTVNPCCSRFYPPSPIGPDDGFTEGSSCPN